jgi:hypothetical protein
VRKAHDNLRNNASHNKSITCISKFLSHSCGVAIIFFFFSALKYIDIADDSQGRMVGVYICHYEIVTLPSSPLLAASLSFNEWGIL